jgi:hypothetical protein
MEKALAEHITAHPEDAGPTRRAISNSHTRPCAEPNRFASRPGRKSRLRPRRCSATLPASTLPPGPPMLDSSPGNHPRQRDRDSHANRCPDQRRHGQTIQISQNT